MSNVNDIMGDWIAIAPKATQSITPRPRDKKSRKATDKDFASLCWNIQVLAEKFIDIPTERNFSLLVRKIEYPLKSYIHRMVKDQYDIDTIYNIVLENLYFKRATYNKKSGKYSTWMYTVARNAAINYMDRGYVPDIVPGDVSDVYDSLIDLNADAPTNAADVIDIVDIIMNDDGVCESYDMAKLQTEIYDASVDCISRLPDNLKIVMTERYINKKKLNKIAIDNNIPMSSVKNWLVKGRIALSNKLKEDYADLCNMYLDCDIAF